MNAAFEAALAAHAAGLCVLPPREDGSKAPDVRSWSGFQRRRPTDRQIEAWYEKERSGLGLVCGLVSGGLEMVEIEGRGVEEGVHHRLRKLADAAGLGTLLDRVMHRY
jgi:putative DNA primase/helicase